jgi:membrane protease YdiL (CAAX protease family)
VYLLLAFAVSWLGAVPVALASWRPGPPPPGAARRAAALAAGVAAAARAHPLGAFLAFFFTVGWAPAFLTHRVETVLPPQVFILATTWLGLLAALLLTRLAGGRAGVRALVRRTVALRAPAGWYAVALLAATAVALPAAVLLLGPPRGGARALLPAIAAGLLLQTAVGLLTNNLWEEVVWMGFVQARLQTRYGAARAVLLTAPLFLLQHLALQEGSAVQIAVFLLLGAAVMLPFRALPAWVYNRTGSLLLVGLLHAASNAAAGGAGFGPGLLPRLYPEQGTESLHVLATALLGVAVFALTRGRLGAGARPPHGALAPAGPAATAPAARVVAPPASLRRRERLVDRRRLAGGGRHLGAAQAPGVARGGAPPGPRRLRPHPLLGAQLPRLAALGPAAEEQEAPGGRSQAPAALPQADQLGGLQHRHRDGGAGPLEG